MNATMHQFNFQWWSWPWRSTVPGPPLTSSLRKWLNRIKSNFMWMKIYILVTCDKILKGFCGIVFKQKFNKLLNIGEEESAVCIKMSDLKLKFSHFQPVKSQWLHNRKAWILSTMWFWYFLTFLLGQIVNQNSRSREISRIIWTISNSKKFEKCTAPNYLCRSEKEH